MSSGTRNAGCKEPHDRRPPLSPSARGSIQVQDIVDTVADPVVVLDRSLTVLTAGRTCFETFRGDRAETLGRKIYKIGNGQWDIPDLRLLLEQVIPRVSVAVGYEVSHEFPGLGRRTMLVSARTLAHPDNAGRSMLLSIVDATDRRRRAAADRIVLGELKHRIKNLFAQTRALARLAGTEGRSAPEYRDALLARLQALADAHDIVFGDDPGSCMAGRTGRVLAPYAAEAPSGSAIRPRSVWRWNGCCRSARYCTNWPPTPPNTARCREPYSVAGWRSAGQRRTAARRCGRPPAPPPEHPGYGSRLIGSVVTYSLHGTARRHFGPDGLKIGIVLPIA